MRCDEVRDAIDAYVLGALDGEEAAAVEAHLADCPACRTKAAEMEHVVHGLPVALAAASSLTPPADLKTRVLGAVAESSRARVYPRHRGKGTGDRGVWTVVESRQWRWAAAAAALVIVAASVVWSVRLSSALDRERAMRERVEAFYSRQQELVLEVVDAPKGTRQILRSPDEGSDAYGKLFTRPDLPDVVVMAARLPAAPEGQAYHLWLMSGGTTVDAGVMPVDEHGFGLLTLKSDRPGPTYDAVEVRLQPSGATAPDGTVVLRWGAGATEG